MLLHEFGHGLGFSTLVDEADGSEFLGQPDVFERFILDTTAGLHWSEMTDIQRAASATNTGNLVWDGPATTFMSHLFLGGIPIMAINSPFWGSKIGVRTEIQVPLRSVIGPSITSILFAKALRYSEGTSA